MGAGEREPLSEHLLAVYQDHYARDGRAAEHLCIELDERDLDDWIDMARASEAGGERLRAALGRLARVGGEFSYHMAGAHWEELCGALSEARAALR